MLKIQAFLLTHVDDENKNVLHLACNKGNYQFCSFIVEFAGHTYLDILKFIIRIKDDMGRTPVYLLCVKGFENKFSDAI